ncbi:MAG: TonB C-terminal domain-containing protein [Chloracidobacterium sp.]|nr:TonB C-terminal domain-containing protein [Chloracidobacterium sp.]
MTTESGKTGFRIEALLSFIMHVVALGVCAWYFRNPLTANIIAAGEGQGGGGNAIEVSTVDGKFFGLTTPRQVSYAGDEPNAANNEDLATKATPDTDADVLPTTNPTPNPKDKITDRPTAESPKIFSKTPLRGSSSNTSVDIGRTMGSPVPSIIQGIGVSSGAIGPNGVPGGSEYGRRIQMILSRNYNPPSLSDVSGTQYVVVMLRIARDGRILSLVNGRVGSNYFKKRCPIDIVNYAAERAVIASNPLPEIPNGFLMGSQEGVAEIWFKYPK